VMTPLRGTAFFNQIISHHHHHHHHHHFSLKNLQQEKG
jgi:hypothetical protein